MSKFDKAAKAAAKPAAKATAEPPAPAPSTKPAVELKTLEEKRKYVLKHEIKIEDVQDNAKNEPNKAKKEGIRE
jgi:hypothetical protein